MNNRYLYTALIILAILVIGCIIYLFYRNSSQSQCACLTTAQVESIFNSSYINRTGIVMSIHYLPNATSIVDYTNQNSSYFGPVPDNYNITSGSVVSYNSTDPSNYSIDELIISSNTPRLLYNYETYINGTINSTGSVDGFEYTHLYYNFYNGSYMDVIIGHKDYYFVEFVALHAGHILPANQIAEILGQTV